MARALISVFIFVCMAFVEAFACRGPTLERTIIFDDVPSSLDAPVIVEVTITDMSNVSDPSTGWIWAVMNARVDRVIKGPIDDRTLKIVTEIDDCTRGFGAGSHGIVVGTLRNDTRGARELVAISESQSERWSRKARERDK